MQDSMLQRIAASPAYRELRARRLRFGWTLTIALLVVYYGFIGIIAFDKTLFAARLGSGVVTWGIPAGFAVILFTIVITAIYVIRANGEYDALTERIRREAQQ